MCGFRALWSALVSLPDRTQAIRESPITLPNRYGLDPSFDLGFEIGSILRFINGDTLPADLVWGLILSSVGEPSDNVNTEARNLIDLFDNLNNRYEWRLVTAGKEASESDAFDEEKRAIRESLRDHGIAPAPQLVNIILKTHLTGDEDDYLESRRERGDITTNKSHNPDPPEEMPSTEEMRRTAIDMLVERFLAQTELHAIDTLAKDLREDAYRVQQREWRGVDPTQAIMHVGASGESHIQDFEQTESKGQNNMTTALRKLSNDDSSWINRPVFRENEGEHVTWELTTYGRLLYRVIEEYNCSTNWLYTWLGNLDNTDEMTSELQS